MLGNTNSKCDANMEIKKTTTFSFISVEYKSNFALDIFSNQSIILLFGHCIRIIQC